MDGQRSEHVGKLSWRMTALNRCTVKSLEKKGCLSLVIGFDRDPAPQLAEKVNSWLINRPQRFNSDWLEWEWSRHVSILGFLSCGGCLSCRCCKCRGSWDFIYLLLLLIINCSILQDKKQKSSCLRSMSSSVKHLVDVTGLRLSADESARPWMTSLNSMSP